MGKNYSSDTMGRFEFLPGMERGGSPVYRQSHSNKVPSGLDFLLYRWEKHFLRGAGDKISVFLMICPNGGRGGV